MQMTHNPEPWRMVVSEMSGNPVVVDLRGRFIAASDQDDDPNFERIVACVNFCREFETEWLKARTMRSSRPYSAVQLVPVAVNDGKQA